MFKDAGGICTCCQAESTCEEARMGQSGKLPDLQSAGSEHSGGILEAAAGLCGSDQLLIKTVHLADSPASVAFDKAANPPPPPPSTLTPLAPGATVAGCISAPLGCHITSCPR